MVRYMNTIDPIFVIGTPRSGTTLIAKILGNHPDIFMPGETHFFPDIYTQIDVYGDPPKPDKVGQIFDRFSNLFERYNEPEDQKRVNELLKEKANQDSLRNACSISYKLSLDIFMEMQMHHIGKNRWGNNAPRDLFHVEDILKFYPNAIFVACVRDPRDFLLSYKGKWRVTRNDNVERLKKLYHPVITSLLWKSSVRRILRLNHRLPRTQWMTIRYEDLVNDSEHTVTKICNHVNVDYQPSLLEVKGHNSSIHGNDHQTGIFRTSIDRWRKDLNTEDVVVAQRLVGKEMRKLGYEVVERKPNIIKIVMLYLSAPFHLAKALRANSAITGPLIPYILKRFRALFT